MKFIKEHDQLLEDVFGDELPEDLVLTDSSDYYGLEDLNPPDAIEVANFSDEVENWTTWNLQSHFYVCKVPKLKDTYLLFAIDWDDNWGQWERKSWDAVEGLDTHQSAAAVLLKHFADENIEHAGGGGWELFLESLRK